MKSLKKITITLGILLIACFIFIQSLVIAAQFQYKPEKSDAILILGYALEDGLYPDEWLRLRLQKGLDLFNEGYGNYIIVSGGIGPTDQIPVAIAMKSWLLEREVPEDRILTEEKSNTTYENIVFSKEIMADKSIDSVVVVTNDFHIYRSMLIAKAHLPNCSGSPSYTNRFFKKLFSYIREDMAVVKYLFLRR